MDALNIQRKNNDTTVIKKIKSKRVKSPEVQLKKITDQLELIRSTVEDKLGKFKLKFEVITDLAVLNKYFDTANLTGELSIDTETTGLDPIEDKIVGLCIYVPGLKAAYVPINHVDYITGIRYSNQLNEEEVANSFIRLNNSVKNIMFNSTFDIRVIRNQLNVYLKCYWDGYIAARLLNENEESNALKKLHQKYVLDNKEDEFTFDAFFKGITFDKVPIDCAYLYGAHDALITYELYKFQKQYLSLNSNREDLKKLALAFHNIEMPCVDVVCDMEDAGVSFDLNYAKELSIKYNKQLDDRLKDFYNQLEPYKKQIAQYKNHILDNKLSDPINIASPTQLAILLYDIIKIKPIDKKHPRGTGSAILEKINIPLTQSILEYRKVAILIKTFIDKLPNVVNKHDGKIHCKFNQYGAVTGRFSSSDPNLQNIPSHNKDIRKMFVASPGCVLMSSDFSQQEPKALAALCKQAGDSQMYNTFMQGKDLYSEIASKAFNVPYEDCLEFNPDGTTNADGKERRRQAKSILLGVLYGRGEASIAEQLNCTVDKAKAIKDSVFKGFPAIKKFEDDSLNMAYDLGYVTTICGRKRRLYELWLDEFEFTWNNDITLNDDVINYDSRDLNIPQVPIERQKYYLKKLSHCWYSEKQKIFDEARQEGIRIIDNGGKIADATRQTVNARIQGSAADLTKYAMIKLNTNERLKKLGFKLLIQVHDEVIAECPEENAKECKKLLAETMSHAAEEILNMPIKCDVAVSKQWYGEEINL